jgi:hypothetical protein
VTRTAPRKKRMIGNKAKVNITHLQPGVDPMSYL